MSTPLYADGDVGLVIRTKINNLNELLRIMETNVLIPAGATTSIPVTTLERNLLPVGEKITIVNAITGDAYELELGSPAENAGTTLTINEYTFLTDIPVGSGIYYKISDLLSRAYAL